MVFVSHYGGRLQGILGSTLWVGVDLFFVLSGFLITGILYDSLESPHYFRNFYVRRALRIFPVFYGFFLVVAILAPIFHLHAHWNVLTFVFYFGNLVVPFTDVIKHNPTIIWIVHHGVPLEIINLGHLWSLCVEEQFYLVWPAVVWLVRDRRALMRVCVMVSIAALLLRFWLLKHATPLEITQYIFYWNTFVRCDSLVIGSWLALFLRGHKLSLVQLRRLSAVLFWVPLAGLAFDFVHWRRWGFFNNPFTMTVGFTLIALAALGTLLRSLDDDGLLARVLRFRPLSGLGVISYGFYFYHAIPITLWRNLAVSHPALKNVVPLMAFSATVVVAWLSFHFFEVRFLALKKVLAPQRPRSSRVKGSAPVRVHVSEPQV
jgi:peptidoglycan/LPS O-acetylase OafA/YrhL